MWNPNCVSTSPETSPFPMPNAASSKGLTIWPLPKYPRSPPFLPDGPYTVTVRINGYAVADFTFSNLTPGTYTLVWGGIDAISTTSVDDMFYLGEIGREILQIR